jgi:hypothetical protein
MHSGNDFVSTSEEALSGKCLKTEYSYLAFNTGPDA